MSAGRRPKKVVLTCTGKRPVEVTSRHIEEWQSQIGNVNIDTPVEMPVGVLWEVLRLASVGREAG